MSTYKTALKPLVTGVLLAGLASTAAAYQGGDFILRGGSISVDPTDGHSSVAGGAFDLRAGSDTQLGVSLTYMATDRFGAELQAATPFKHDVNARGAGTVGDVKHLPPTLTLNYYPLGGSDARLQPYLGAGLNYTFFWGENLTALGETATGATDLDAGDSWGLAGQAGVDYRINDQFGVGASVYYIDIESKVDLDGNRIGKLSIDPMVYRLNLTYRF